MSRTTQKINNFFLPIPPRGGFGGGGWVGDQNFKSPVNFMNCRENPPPPTTTGGRSGNFRESKNQKSGKCHELPRKSIIFFYLSHPGGVRGGVGWGSKFQKSGKFHELSRKSIKKNLPPPPPKGVAVGILGVQKIKSPGNVMNCREK